MVLRPNGTAPRTSSGSSSVAYVEPLLWATASDTNDTAVLRQPEREAAVTESAVMRRRRFTGRGAGGGRSWYSYFPLPDGSIDFFA
jgi:hypothetical protein